MSQSKVRTITRKIILFLTAGFALLSLGLVFYYIIVLGKGHYHSDCTDTILWAQAVLDSHRLVSTDFCYAGIMSTGGQLIMLPFLAMFGMGIKAQIGGMICFGVLFVVALIWLGTSLRLEKKGLFLLVGMVLLTTCSSAKFREIYWEHIIYYGLGSLYYMLILGMSIRCIRKEQTLKKRVVLLGILFGFTVFFGMNGMQIAVLAGIPVCFGVLAERFFDFDKPLVYLQAVKNYATAWVLMMGVMLGLILEKLVLHGVKAGYEQAYSSFSDKKDWVNHLFSFFPAFFELLGVDTTTSMVMFSLQGIQNLIRILFCLLLIVVPVVMLWTVRKHESPECRMTLYAHHFMTAFILAGWVFGKLNSAQWRLSPIAVSSVILCVLYLKELMNRGRMKRIAVLLLMTMMGMMAINIREISRMKRQTEQNKNLEVLKDYLMENDLKYGYATFWQANIITMTSGEKVKSRVINIDRSGIKKRLYQTNRHWYEDAGGYDKYFVIFDEEEYNIFLANRENFKDPDEILSCGEYRVFVYHRNIFAA